MSMKNHLQSFIVQLIGTFIFMSCAQKPNGYNSRDILFSSRCKYYSKSFSDGLFKNEIVVINGEKPVFYHIHLFKGTYTPLNGDWRKFPFNGLLVKDDTHDKFKQTLDNKILFYWGNEVELECKDRLSMETKSNINNAKYFVFRNQMIDLEKERSLLPIHGKSTVDRFGKPETDNELIVYDEKLDSLKILVHDSIKTKYK